MEIWKLLRGLVEARVVDRPLEGIRGMKHSIKWATMLLLLLGTTYGSVAHAEGSYACSFNPNPRAASPGHDCSQCESLREERDALRAGIYVMGATAAAGSVTLPIIGAVAGVTVVILIAMADAVEDEMEALGC